MFAPNTKLSQMTGLNALKRKKQKVRLTKVKKTRYGNSLNQYFSYFLYFESSEFLVDKFGNRFLIEVIKFTVNVLCVVCPDNIEGIDNFSKIFCCGIKSLSH